MTRTADHSTRDRLTIASVHGAASRLARAVSRGEVTLDEALAELHGYTTDPHLLAHGVPAPGEMGRDDREQLLLAAGADPAAIAEKDAYHAERERERQRGIPGLSAP